MWTSPWTGYESTHFALVAELKIECLISRPQQKAPVKPGLFVCYCQS